MAAIIIVGSGMLIGYVSSKIFTNYVKTNNNEFTESIDDKFINIEMRKLRLVSEMEEGKLNNYTVNVKGNNFDSFASTNSYNKEICC